MDQLSKIAAPVGRVLLSFMFIYSGVTKITGYEGTAGYMEAMGVPGGLLPLAILVEIAAGAMLLLGWRVRIAAVLLGGFSVVSGVIFHLVPAGGMEGMAQQMQMIMFMKNLTIAGGMAMVFHFGAGAYSLDARAA